MDCWGEPRTSRRKKKMVEKYNDKDPGDVLVPIGAEGERRAWADGNGMESEQGERGRDLADGVAGAKRVQQDPEETGR